MRWRFIHDHPRDAALNMALDEALFSSSLSGIGPATLRLYTWSRPSVSIGYRQDMSEACDLDACRRLDVDTVRRISGGRAVLHHHELTYCITARAEELFRGRSVKDVYAWVTEGLRDAFASMNIVVDPAGGAPWQARPPDETRPTLPCFAVPTGHEITARGRKLVGSAQKWTRRGFLQHGSILLALEPELWKKTTRLPLETDLGAIALSELTERQVEASRLARAIRESFEGKFGQRASDVELSEQERALADLLARRKYTSDAWNLHRQRVDFRESVAG